MDDFQTLKNVIELFNRYTGEHKKPNAIKDLLPKEFDYYSIDEYREMFIEDGKSKLGGKEYRFTTNKDAKLIAFLAAISLTDCSNTNKNYKSAIKNPYKITSTEKTVSKLKAYTKAVIKKSKKLESQAIKNDNYVINYEELFSALNLVDFAEQFEEKITKLIYTIFLNSSHSPALLQKVLDRIDACISEIDIISAIDGDIQENIYNTPDVSIAAAIADQLFYSKNANPLIVERSDAKKIADSPIAENIESIKENIKKRFNSIGKQVDDETLSAMVRKMMNEKRVPISSYENLSDVRGRITDYDDWIRIKNVKKLSYQNYLNYLIDDMTAKYNKLTCCHDEQNKQELIERYVKEFGICTSNVDLSYQISDMQNWIFRELESYDKESFSVKQTACDLKKKVSKLLDKSKERFDKKMSDSRYDYSMNMVKESMDKALVECFNIYTEIDLETLRAKKEKKNRKN